MNPKIKFRTSLINSILRFISITVVQHKTNVTKYQRSLYKNICKGIIIRRLKKINFTMLERIC